MLALSPTNVAALHNDQHCMAAALQFALAPRISRHLSPAILSRGGPSEQGNRGGDGCHGGRRGEEEEDGGGGGGSFDGSGGGRCIGTATSTAGFEMSAEVEEEEWERWTRQWSDRGCIVVADMMRRYQEDSCTAHLLSELDSR